VMKIVFHVRSRKRSECNLVEFKEPKAQKVRMQKSRVKIMLSAFFMLKVLFITNLCRKSRL
jgi:hypothetical protein